MKKLTLRGLTRKRNKTVTSYGLHYDRNGKRISLSRWQILFYDKDYRRIGLDVANGYHVSTVWLGISNYFGKDKKYGIFETAISIKHTFDHAETVIIKASSEKEAILNHVISLEDFAGTL